MGSLIALVLASPVVALATPVFGFELTPPDAVTGLEAPLVFAAHPEAEEAGLRNGPVQRNAQDSDEDLEDLEDETLEDEDIDAIEDDAERDGDEEGDEDLDDIELDDLPDMEIDLGGELGGVGLSPEYNQQLQERADLAGIHRPLGIATWAAMGVTLLLGGIQYHNLYGTGSALEDTPCVQGNAIFGQGQCSGTPYLHLISSMATTALYTATFVTSVLMPDPGDLDEGDSEYAENLRQHKVLRWVHFGGMIAQLALGAVIANAESFGLDRANDYGTLQALSTVHLGLGIVTFGAMTWAGALFTL